MSILIWTVLVVHHICIIFSPRPSCNVLQTNAQDVSFCGKCVKDSDYAIKVSFNNRTTWWVNLSFFVQTRCVEMCPYKCQISWHCCIVTCYFYVNLMKWQHLPSEVLFHVFKRFTQLHLHNKPITLSTWKKNPLQLITSNHPNSNKITFTFLSKNHSYFISWYSVIIQPLIKCYIIQIPHSCM